jgi:hypothetical protein
VQYPQQQTPEARLRALEARGDKHKTDIQRLWLRTPIGPQDVGQAMSFGVGVPPVGTVTWTNGSGTLTGLATRFVDDLTVGTILADPTGVQHSVTGITSQTSLTFTPLYNGTTVSGQPISIILPPGGGASPPACTPGPGPFDALALGLTLFRWSTSAGRWVYLSHSCAAGTCPAATPTDTGLYDGQLRILNCRTE